MFSRAKSVYIRLSFAFSASRSFSRMSSETLTPPYFARQLKYVGRLIPCLRIRSLIGTPDSPSFRISAICASLNLDFLMDSPPVQRVHYLPVSMLGEPYGCRRRWVAAPR